ncbi:hypothetical protein [Pseudomonas delhiensis]|uniref:hypothetical protein n=1 Tax=Pseudomonas delhiensis TaxID=366289 RepID=UPI0028B54F3E
MSSKAFKPNTMSADELADLLRTADGGYSSERYAEIFGISPAKLALQGDKYRRAGDIVTRSESEQCFIRDALQVVRAATSSGVTLSRAIEWFRNEPISAFDSRTAEQLVSEGKVDQLLRFLESWQAGSQG